MKVRFAARTTAGRVRPSNQDAVLAIPADRPETWVFAVADGVGGLVDGADASEFVVSEVAEAAVHGDGPLAPRVQARLLQASDEIFRRGAEAGRPSGTTVVLLAIEDGNFWTMHAGDSRAYLFRGERLERLTEDHAWVAEQVRAGAMTAQQAETSPYRNVITRAVGAEPSLALDLRAPAPCASGDLYLLSSDGLHGLVNDEEIAAIVLGGGSPDEIADRLVDAANKRGGTDNISVVVVAGE